MEGTIENNAFLERYYCPLKFNLYDKNSGEDECWYEIEGKYGSEYEGAINDPLEKEHSYDGCSPEDMATLLSFCYLRSFVLKTSSK